MYCDKGSECVYSSSQVHTMEYARLWYAEVKEEQIPIRVLQQKSASGRIYAEIYDKNNKLIHTRG
jgi:hypothetical protein